MINNLSNCLSADEREACEGLLTMKECLTTLSWMVRGSAPGVDGFSVEFNLAFWDILGRDLVCVRNCAHELGHKIILFYYVPFPVSWAYHSFS